MEAGNTSIQMRNTGQSILDTLLKSKSINKAQYQKLVKKYFKVGDFISQTTSASLAALGRHNHIKSLSDQASVSERGRKL